MTHSLTDSFTDSCLVNLIDVTLACEDAYSKLVEVVTVADVSDEDRVGNSLLQIWKLRFGQKAKLLFNLNLGRDSEARIGQYLEDEVQAGF